ncbi:hypothetical protein PULV_a0602 [Pseudoalteromonas ulvae UL12]|nr:hypothetical protein [Pseudoalteromonas ulvae UL12]
MLKPEIGSEIMPSLMAMWVSFLIFYFSYMGMIEQKPIYCLLG